MSIELKKEVVKLNETTCQVKCEAFVEADIIVPDVKPDIEGILQIDANPVIMDKTVMQDKVMFEGLININIIYVAENGLVKSINTKQSFSHQAPCKDAKPGQDIEAFSTINNLNYHLINSRKLSISTTVGIEFCLMNDVETEFTVGFENEENYQALFSPIKAYVTENHANSEISVRETLEAPIGNPDIDDILKVDVKLNNKDVRITGNKAIVKGDLMCSTLYICEMDPSSVQHIEHELGFTEILDIPYCEENQDCDIEFNIKSINYSIKQDMDGDNRLVFMDVLMDATVKTSTSIALDVLTDAYSTNNVLDIKRKQVELDEMAANFKTQATFKGTATLPEGMPDISQVFNVSANPNIGTTNLENGQANVEGDININILYESNDPQKPVNSYNFNMPYDQIFDLSNADDSMNCEVNVEVDHVSFNMSLSNEVDIRCVLGISLKVFKKQTAEFIDEVEELDPLEKENASTYCIKIYFVQKGDTLWNICKNYKVSIDSLAQANQLDLDDKLTVGQQIIIP